MAWDRSREQIIRRFEMQHHIDEETGCWIWHGASNEYGRFSIYGEAKHAHIVSWYLNTGEWPKKFVCHKCDTPLCVNPDHLFLGTARDNTHDALRKGRKLGAPIKNDPEPIRVLLRIGLYQREIARITGASQATVSEIKRGVR